MSQAPGPDAGWTPLAGSQFLDVGVSTALTIPAAPTTGNRVGIEYVAILLAQTVAQFYRTDGSAVTAAVTGGIQLNPGDFVILYGLQALRAVRVIRSGAGGSLAISYYFYRPAS